MLRRLNRDFFFFFFWYKPFKDADDDVITSVISQGKSCTLQTVRHLKVTTSSNGTLARGC